MARENLYSRFIAWLKILLPLAALGILSSVVFFASDEDQRTIPFVTQEGAADAGRERVTSPEYVGVTSNGASITIRAETVNPIDGDPKRLNAYVIEGEMLSDGGRVTHATAPDGLIDFTGNVAHLNGEVEVITSDGYRVITQGLMARLDITLAEGGGPVHGDSPLGTIDAGGVMLSESQPGQSLLVFNGGVKLIYEPRMGKADE